MSVSRDNSYALRAITQVSYIDFFHVVICRVEQVLALSDNEVTLRFFVFYFDAQACEFSCIVIADVTDGAFMTSSACQNPSLTYMAFTARACDYAVNELKKGNL